MPDITFRFNLEKLVNALAFFCEKGVTDLTKLKAAKLLYFADKEHLLRYGRPILGDVYFCMPYGPVPSVSLNQMNDAISTPEIEDDDANVFRCVVKIHKPFFSQHRVFQFKRRFDREVFSQSELDVLEETSRRYGPLSAGQLVKLTHQEPTWTIPNEQREPQGSTPIPYELFFAGAPGPAQEVLRTLRSEQEESRELDFLLGHKTR